MCPVIIDRSERSIVVVCDLPGCGARQLLTEPRHDRRRAAADAWIGAHLAAMHPTRHTEPDPAQYARVLANLHDRETYRQRRQ